MAEENPDLVDYMYADPRVFTLLEMYPAAGIFSAWVNQRLEYDFGLGPTDPQNDGGAFEQYFTLARELQFPDTETIGRVYDGVIDALNDTSNKLNEFGDTMLSALAEWEGEAKNKAATYIGQVRDFVLEEATALNHLAAGILAYGCLITAYRENVNKLMESASQACQQKEEADDGAWLDVLIVSAAAIIGAVATVATAGAGGLAALGTFTAATATITGEVVATATKIDSSTWEAIKSSYLDQQQQLNDDFAEALLSDIPKHLTQVEENLPPDVRSPEGLGDPEKFHPESDSGHDLRHDSAYVAPPAAQPDSRRSSRIHELLGPESS